MSDWVGREPVEIAKQMVPLALPLEVRADLDRFIYDCGYRAPEQRHEMVERLGELVSEAVGAPPLMDDWRIGMVAALMNQTTDETLALFGPRP